MNPSHANTPAASGNELLLLCLDLQPVFLRTIADTESVQRRCAFAIQAAAGLGIDIAFTEQVPQKLGGTAPELLSLAPSATPFGKNCFSAFADDGIRDSISSRKIEHLLLCGAKAVTDLSPLARLPRLKVLHLCNTQASDLSPLHALPLIVLKLSGSAVTDLSPLRGLELQSLMLDGTAVRDFSPLLDCKKLVNLVVPTGAPGIEVLKQHPALKYLSTKWDSRLNRPDTTVDEFWKKVGNADSEVP